MSRVLCCLSVIIVFTLLGCQPKEKTEPKKTEKANTEVKKDQAEPAPDAADAVAEPKAEAPDATPEAPNAADTAGDVAAQTPQAEADAFLSAYYEDVQKAEKAYTTAEWVASTTGKKEDFDALSAAKLEYKKLHSDSERYKTIERLLQSAAELDAHSKRALELAYLSFKENQLPAETIEKMVTAGTEIQQIFNTFRGKLGEQVHSNNELLEMLGKETDSAKREAAWGALKQVGEAVGPKLIALAKLRNAAAVELGYANYWDMQVRLQEYDPKELLAIFSELEAATNEPFKAMKEKLDAELAPKYGIEPANMMPWHYDNPFFQAAPPSTIDLDEFYKDKAKEDLIEIARSYYAELDMPIDDIIERSDLYEREGKDQHAFCTDIDREGDIRSLMNIKATAEWMDTILHEMGHAVYFKWINRELPFVLRGCAHIFTTEAVAMLFGALGKNGPWMIKYAGATPERVAEIQDAIIEQRRREQLIFARWALVMLNFEKALYENPDQDLNTLWWDMVERYQMLKRPPERNAADWASKPHFTIAPVYYHNYMLGELFAAQLRATIAKQLGHEGPTSTMDFNGRKEIGAFFKDKIFAPGMTLRWPEFVAAATGEALSASFFAAELK
ncbi:MAG: M2 family metallopeptidase [Myxococcota bacterium]|jgi:peptidyl-dipeptidase A|nr:M2 family metallopeptidase [Myxococcota bacterium]